MSRKVWCMARLKSESVCLKDFKRPAREIIFLSTSLFLPLSPRKCSDLRNWINVDMVRCEMANGSWGLAHIFIFSLCVYLHFRLQNLKGVMAWKVIVTFSIDAYCQTIQILTCYLQDKKNDCKVDAIFFCISTSNPWLEVMVNQRHKGNGFCHTFYGKIGSQGEKSFERGGGVK